jgi:peroxin-14
MRIAFCAKCSSAVLQDPSVASSPLEKRIAFLQSKNLTKEEIDTALLRAGGNPAAISTSLVPAGTYPSPPALPPGNVYGPGYVGGPQYQQALVG